MRLVIILAISVWLFSSCTQEQKPLKIAANQWIGYTPLFYAQEKGWLKKNNFSLQFVSSLSESLNLYHTHTVDAMTSTQYEYFKEKKKNPDTVPALLFDRSNGGDMILSNKPLSTLLKSKRINIYMEQDSINSLLLNAFAKTNQMNPKYFIYHETNPYDLQTLVPDSSKDILVVTYAPYHVPLLKHGYKIIDSTKSLQSLLVIDMLCTDKKILSLHKQQFIKLKSDIDKAIQISQEDPKAYYEVVKSYLDNIDFQIFTEDIDSILWVNHTDEKLLKTLHSHHIDTSYIIR